jgi:(+)-trans-carveol dehydrogenase
MIRVNSVHPTSVNTDMVHNDATYRLFAPDIENPTAEQVAPRFGEMNALPINLVEARDISNAVLFLASDEARYITGVTLPVDAGALVK